MEHKVRNAPELTSEIFYKVMLRYALSEEQLEEHGYPIPVNLSKSLDEGKFDLIGKTFLENFAIFEDKLMLKRFFLKNIWPFSSIWPSFFGCHYEKDHAFQSEKVSAKKN